MDQNEELFGPLQEEEHWGPMGELAEGIEYESFDEEPPEAQEPPREDPPPEDPAPFLPTILPAKPIFLDQPRRRTWSPVTGEYVCPHCKMKLNPANIPDEVLLSERGRRNSAKRKASFEKNRIWDKHSLRATFCRCWDCWWVRLVRDVKKFHQNVAAQRNLTGGDPWWTQVRRVKLQAREKELLAALPEGVVPPRRLEI